MVTATVVALMLAQGSATIIKEARALEKSAVKLADGTKNRRMFMLVDQKRWVKMAKETDHLKQGMWRDNVSLVAYAFSQSGRTVLVSFTGSSPSGDWMSTTECVYRKDGSLATCNEGFSSFSPEGRYHAESIFDRKGKRVSFTSKVVDFDGKPVSKETAETLKSYAADTLPKVSTLITLKKLTFLR